MKRKITFLFAAGILSGILTGTATAQTIVPSLIQSNQVWDMSGSPYLINQNTYVDAGIQLKIMPGVQVIAANNNISLQVDGDLRVLGTYDSLVHFDKLQLQFTAKATSFDTTTLAGCYLNYCDFTSPGSGKRVISIVGPSIRIENCQFHHTYYTIYVSSAGSIPNRIEVWNSTFTDSTGLCYALYASSSHSDINFVGNEIHNNAKGGGMYVYAGNLDFVGNKVDGPNYMRVESPSATLKCNDFKNMKSGIQAYIYAMDSLHDIVLTHNTLDSFGNSMYNTPMLEIICYNPKFINHSRFNYNNFLHYFGSGTKVALTGSNPTPSTFSSIDMKTNFWSSTDSTTIESYITDYADDIKRVGRADFSGFLSYQDTACVDPIASSCHSSFYFAMDTTDLYNLYVINTSTGRTSNSHYSWNFGDGTGSSQEKPNHTYSEYKKYRLCLTVYNVSEKCLSTFCDSIGLDSNGTFLKKGFSINVLNESDITSVVQRNILKDVRVYPNPSTGLVMIDMTDAGSNPLQVQIRDMSGKLILTQSSTPTGDSHHLLDLNNLKPGIYLINIRKGERYYSTKIIISQ